MTADLAGFFLAQLDADEAVARAATPGPWHVYVGTLALYVNNDDRETVCSLEDIGPAYKSHDSDAAHIALHDPAFELDRIAWLRTVVEEHCWDASLPQRPNSQCPTCLVYAPCATLLALAQPYRSRPGWRDEWTVGE